MMRRIAGLAALVVAVLAVDGCKPDLPVDPNAERHPDLSGDWAYTASEMRISGSTTDSSCTIEGVMLTLGEWHRDGLDGRSSGGEIRCGGELAHFSGPLPSYPVGRGGMYRHYFSFDIGTPDWRHEGQVSHDTVRTVSRGDTLKTVVFGDTLSGQFKLVNGSIKFEGKYRAVRRSR